MKKILKNIFIISLISIFLMSNVSFATLPNVVDGNGNPIDLNGNSNVPNNGNASGVAGEISAKGNQILSAILWAGYAISLGMVVFIGIKYITGAADAKANMKSAIVNWLIGAFIVFMCTTIIGWVMSAASVGSGEGLASDIINAAN